MEWEGGRALDEEETQNVVRTKSARKGRGTVQEEAGNVVRCKSGIEAPARLILL